uniref:Ig-like domain-containing protein n=1 Tax=Lepisosteus oculatus TaxID=7918 RepID=W5N784_LEPOC
MFRREVASGSLTTSCSSPEVITPCSVTPALFLILLWSSQQTQIQKSFVWQQGIMGLFLLLLLVRGAVSVTVRQYPTIEFGIQGSTLKINCEVTGSASPSIYWFKQQSHSDLNPLFYSVASGNVDPPTQGHFSATRPNGSHFILESTALTVDDSAVYFCAGSTHSA